MSMCQIAYNIIDEYIGGDFIPYVVFGRIVEETDTTYTIEWKHHNFFRTTMEKKKVRFVPKEHELVWQ